MPVVAVALGGVALGLVLVGRYYGLGLLAFVLLAIPIVLALVYVSWYRTLPYEPIFRTTAPAEEPFDDPVEEADRIGTDPDEGDAVEDPLDPS